MALGEVEEEVDIGEEGVAATEKVM